MKKISTLGFAVLFSLASFAAFSPSRLTVSAEGNNDISVTVDGNRSGAQLAGSSVVFENLQPGFHQVSVYRLTDRRFGFFGPKRGADYRLVYSSSVNIRPMFTTSIALDRFGRVDVIEQPMRRNDNDRKWDTDRKDDQTYYDRDPRNESAYSYKCVISNADFFAAQRVMDRESDNGRLLYAKRLADENWMSAEQVKELARFFSFDNCRFEFVQYAYSKTIDKDNFRVVCSAFVSNDGRNRVENFLRSCK